MVKRLEGGVIITQAMFFEHVANDIIGQFDVRILEDELVVEGFVSELLNFLFELDRLLV